MTKNRNNILGKFRTVKITNRNAKNEKRLKNIFLCISIFGFISSWGKNEKRDIENIVQITATNVRLSFFAKIANILIHVEMAKLKASVKKHG